MDHLQVYFSKELVGHLKLDGRRYADRDHVIVNLTKSWDLTKSPEELYLETAIRTWSIDDAQVARDGEAGVVAKMAKANVPAYAMMSRNALRYSQDYYWRVVKIHEDHFDRYETLFDQDLFEPIDAGAFCPEFPKVSVTIKPDAKISGRSVKQVWLDEFEKMEPEYKLMNFSDDGEFEGEANLSEFIKEHEPKLRPYRASSAKEIVEKLRREADERVLHAFHFSR